MNSDLLSDWLEYIDSNRPNEGDFGLERLQDIYPKILKKPIAKKIILVGGTNGKGTTVEYLNNFFLTAGYKVGTYTSPHLIKFNERIRLNNQHLDDKKIINAFKLIDDLKKGIRLTYFDYATLAAFNIFSNEDLDFVILEIGIGGKYDPVNLTNADLSIITNIELDHEKWLGSSIEEIGSQKAAILKEGKIAILGSQNMPKSVVEVAESNCSNVYQMNKDFKVEKNTLNWSYNFSQENLEVSSLSYGSLNSDAAGCAMTAFKILCEEEIDFRTIIKKTYLKGRCDVVDNFILDVSHNPASVKNLISFLKKNYKDIQFSAIFAAMADKDISSIIKDISEVISDWNICSIKDNRFDTDSMVQLTENLTHKKVNKSDSVYSAVYKGYMEGTPQIVFGSFITVSQAYSALEKIKIANR
tara:strand:- start:4525 stop:5766 length:1242 start_codon:yes stop_codon:yes gene_type:complete